MSLAQKCTEFPKFDLSFPNNIKTASLNVKTKTYHCKLIKVSACLISLPITGVQSRTVRPQLAINILHSYM